MPNGSQQIVQKLWNYCNILRDDGLSYGDYVEQLTFLLFLKMADEQSRPPFNKPSPIPKEFDWDRLVKLDGDKLEIHYRHTLEELGKKTGIAWPHFPEGPKQGARSGQTSPVGCRSDR
jgi:type I restriction enzyme M protein